MIIYGQFMTKWPTYFLGLPSAILLLPQTLLELKSLGTPGLHEVGHFIYDSYLTSDPVVENEAKYFNFKLFVVPNHSPNFFLLIESFKTLAKISLFKKISK